MLAIGETLLASCRHTHKYCGDSYWKGSVECASRTWLPSLQAKPLVFVHVGKAAGGTVRAELIAGLRRNPGAARIMEVHMEPPPVHLLEVGGIFIARDPVDRVVSAFNWRLPKGGGRGLDPQDEPAAKRVEERLYRCFTHPEPFARALVVGLSDASSADSGSQSSPASSCERAAREAWTTHLKHVGQGLEYYYGALPLPQLRYVLLEAERLGEDLACLRHRLLPLPWREQPRVHDHYPARNQTITSETRAALRSVLSREYEVLHELRKHAQPACPHGAAAGSAAADASNEPNTAACGVELVKQTSRAQCTLGKSFGCLDNSTIWVSLCRGTFQCAPAVYETSTVEQPPFHCGYPPGKLRYTCSCDGMPSATTVT